MLELYERYEVVRGKHGAYIEARTYIDTEKDTLVGAILGIAGEYAAVLRTSEEDEVTSNLDRQLSSLAFYAAARYYVMANREYFNMVMNLLEQIASGEIDTQDAEGIVVLIQKYNPGDFFSLN